MAAFSRAQRHNGKLPPLSVIAGERRFYAPELGIWFVARVGFEPTLYGF